jgi:hypothetical protein
VRLAIESVYRSALIGVNLNSLLVQSLVFFGMSYWAEGARVAPGLGEFQ